MHCSAYFLLTLIRCRCFMTLLRWINISREQKKKWTQQNCVRQTHANKRGPNSHQCVLLQYFSAFFHAVMALLFVRCPEPKSVFAGTCNIFFSFFFPHFLLQFWDQLFDYLFHHKKRCALTCMWPLVFECELNKQKKQEAIKTSFSVGLVRRCDNAICYCRSMVMLGSE